MGISTHRSIAAPTHNATLRFRQNACRYHPGSNPCACAHKIDALARAVIDLALHSLHQAALEVLVNLLNYDFVFRRQPIHMCRQDPGRKSGNTLSSRKMTKATRGGLCATSVRTSLSFSVGELQLCGSTWGAFTPLRIPGPPTDFDELSMNSPQHALTGGKSERGPKASSERGRTKFQHHWLEEEDENGDKLRHYIVPDKDDRYKVRVR